MTKKIWIGAHTSAAGGVHNAVYEGRDIGATTIQLFTSNQKQWEGRTISDDEIMLWEKALAETGIGQVMSHSSYLINLGSANIETLKKSRKAFHEEIDRCRILKIPFLNFHPGAAAHTTEEACLETVIESLLEISEENIPKEPEKSALELGQSPYNRRSQIGSYCINTDQLAKPAVVDSRELSLKPKNRFFRFFGDTRLLMETTAGQGSNIGYCFEQLATIVRAVHHKVPIGITIDTCHVFAAGYDIRTPEGWDKTLDEFDKIIGLDYLYAFHLNDSMKELGSRIDRHAPIGMGQIGLDSFRYLMTNSKTMDLPKYLETPDGPELWKKEIALLKNFVEKR